MKRNEVMALIATTILMFAVCLSASTKGKRQSQSSMHRNEHKLSGILKRHQLGNKIYPIVAAFALTFG